jgi:hypothetical protein
MRQDNLFLSSQNPHSKRWAIMEDDGTSAWLYVTEPNSEKPVADAFVYNRIPPIASDRLCDYRKGPPPVTTTYAGPGAFLPHPPAARQFQIIWSDDGESAAVLMAGEPIACILHGQKSGHSRNLTAAGPFGHPWDQKMFVQVFRP